MRKLIRELNLELNTIVCNGEENFREFRNIEKLKESIFKFKDIEPYGKLYKYLDEFIKKRGLGEYIKVKNLVQAINYVNIEKESIKELVGFEPKIKKGNIVLKNRELKSVIYILKGKTHSKWKDIKELYDLGKLEDTRLIPYILDGYLNQTYKYEGFGVEHILAGFKTNIEKILLGIINNKESKTKEIINALSALSLIDIKRYNDTIKNFIGECENLKCIECGIKILGNFSENKEFLMKLNNKNLSLIRTRNKELLKYKECENFLRDEFFKNPKGFEGFIKEAKIFNEKDILNILDKFKDKSGNFKKIEGKELEDIRETYLEALYHARFFENEEITDGLIEIINKNSNYNYWIIESSLFFKGDKKGYEFLANKEELEIKTVGLLSKVILDGGKIDFKEIDKTEKRYKVELREILKRVLRAENEGHKEVNFNYDIKIKIEKKICFSKECLNYILETKDIELINLILEKGIDLDKTSLDGIIKECFDNFLGFTKRNKRNFKIYEALDCMIKFIYLVYGKHAGEKFLIFLIEENRLSHIKRLKSIIETIDVYGRDEKGDLKEYKKIFNDYEDRHGVLELSIYLKNLKDGR